MMNRFIQYGLLVMTLGILSGCTIVKHLDQLQMMAAFSRDKNEQHSLIENTDKNYDALAAVVASGKLKEYPDQTAILLNFKEPITKTDMNDGTVRWLYRHSIPQKAKDKIYLFFDAKGKLIKSQQEQIQW